MNVMCFDVFLLHESTFLQKVDFSLDENYICWDMEGTHIVK